MQYPVKHTKSNQIKYFLFKVGIRNKKIRVINLIILFELLDFVCFMGDYILTGVGCDQAVKRSVTGALDN
jgi:hypothetical protein